MIKKWEIKASPAPRFPDRKLLLMSSEGKDAAEKLKKSFTGYMGVVFSSENADFQWAAYLYGASANIEKLIGQELKALSVTTKTADSEPTPKTADLTATKPPEKKEEVAPVPEQKKAASDDKTFEIKKTAPDKKEEAAPVPEKQKMVAEEKNSEIKKAEPEKKKESAAPAIEQFGKSSAPAKTEQVAAPSPIIEKFEQFTPDQSDTKPLAGPLIETFAREGSEAKPPAPAESKDAPAVTPDKVPAAEEKAPPKTADSEAAPPVRKDAKAIDVLYLCPENAKDKADIVKENIAKIVAEKNINFEFRPTGLVAYKAGAGKESIMEEIAGHKFSFILVVAPDAMGEELLREIKKKGYVPKVIAEDNIDKKFRYLNLITDIVLSPRR